MHEDYASTWDGGMELPPSLVLEDDWPWRSELGWMGTYPCLLRGLLIAFTQINCMQQSHQSLHRLGATAIITTR